MGMFQGWGNYLKLSFKHHHNILRLNYYYQKRIAGLIHRKKVVIYVGLQVHLAMKKIFEPNVA